MVIVTGIITRVSIISNINSTSTSYYDKKKKKEEETLLAIVRLIGIVTVIKN